ncbi:MAG: tRNA epoxyqueuosine(34) reductase QueG [Phycisphaerae bacterium]
MTPRERAQIAKATAIEAGFSLAGVTSAEPLAGFEYYRDWLAAGRAGSMEYLRRNVHFRENPGQLLAGAQSILCVAMSYNREDVPPAEQQQSGGFGKVARYARGHDYHSVLKRRLYRVIELLREQVPEPFEARPFVDTGPILERQLAARAGLGWIGKNTLLMNAKLGTYLFLGEIITTLVMEPDGAVADHCGTCTRCLDACPTKAFPAPYQMDASRCISYLTIEHREEIPQAFHKQIGEWVYGCDVCQEVCPHNTRAPRGNDEELLADTTPAYVPLPLLANLTSGDYRRLTKNSAARRATRQMWERNGEIVRGNQG